MLSDLPAALYDPRLRRYIAARVAPDDVDDVLHDVALSALRGVAGAGGGCGAMRTGDTVRHGPTSEEWVVAYIDGDRLAWCGWPSGEALLSDCTLVRACGDDEHWEWVERIAKSASGRRARMCQAMLADRA